MAGWSSLPSKLIRRVADCLLATNDLDCYIDFRAVCPKWRSATDDPKDSFELRFRPHRWIIIDEVFEKDLRLLVNTVSGRLVRKDLPLLRRYYVVATTHGGFFVLADKDRPHAAVVLNPFTGHMIRFKAPIPSYVDISAAALSCHSTGKLSTSSLFSERRSSGRQRSSPTLVLLWDRCYQQYIAVPHSNSFTIEVDDECMGSFPLMRLAVTGGVCAADGWQRALAPLPPASARKIFRLMKLYAIDPNKMFQEKPVSSFADYPGTGDANYLFLVESAGELLGVIKLRKHLKVFRLDNGGERPEPVKSIGDRAIFAGYDRCVSVSTDKFPSIVPNCVYYVKSTDSSLDIYKYDLEDETEERVTEAIDSLNPITLSFASPPFTIVQLLSSYTINVEDSMLPMA